jgi:hypothetical protein
MAGVAGFTDAELVDMLGVTPPGTPGERDMFRDQKAFLNRIPGMNLAAVNARIAAAAQPVAPAAAGAQPPAPRVGGLKLIDGTYMAWTGGSAITPLAQPKSLLALRPADYKGMSKLESKCMEGLPVGRQLSIPDSLGKGGQETKSSVTMSSWIRGVRIEIEQRGMDSVFHMINGAPANEVYLLEKWGMAKKDDVAGWVEDLETVNDPYDAQNLRMSSTFLLNSLDVEMLAKVEQQLMSGGRGGGVTSTGPEVFAAVVGIYHTINESTVRHLTARLQALKLVEQDGENVDEFGDKVLEYARKIQGAGTDNVPSDLPHIVYTCFKGAKSNEFES